MKYIIVRTPVKYWIYEPHEEYIARMRYSEESKYYVEAEMYTTFVKIPQI